MCGAGADRALTNRSGPFASGGTIPTMRAALFLLALVGCGRLGFGEGSPNGANGATDAAVGEDALESGPTPQFCDDRVVTTLPIGPLDAVAIRAVALSASYAIAIETVDRDIPLIEADASAAFVATHMPFRSTYGPLRGMSEHNDLPVIQLRSEGDGYIKYVQPGWEAYGTGPLGGDVEIDPSYAELTPSAGIAGQIFDGTLYVGVVQDNDPGTITSADYIPTDAVSASITVSSGGARVAVEKTGGACETFIVSPDNKTHKHYRFSPCYAPKVAAIDDMFSAIVHRTDDIGPYAVHIIPADADGVGTTLPLPGATYARIAARIDGAIWVGHTSGSYRGLTRIAPSGAVREHRENVPGFYFDLTERDAFWYDGATVHVSTPCLR